MLLGWHLPITRTELQPCNYSPLDLTGRSVTRGLLARVMMNATGTLSQGSHKVTTGGRVKGAAHSNSILKT